MFKKILWTALPLFLTVSAFLYLRSDESLSLEGVASKDSKSISRILHFIENNYVDPPSVDPIRMVKSAAKELQRNIAPLVVKEKDDMLDVNYSDKRIRIPLTKSMSLEGATSPLSKILGFVAMSYQGRLDDEERLSLAMTGVTDTLDPHSNYLTPKVYNEFKIGTKGNFGGLGIVIGIRDGDLTVIAPLEGTPAYEAGIKAKDKIVQIGEESTINMGLTEAVDKLRGLIGSKVAVTITREGLATPLKLELTRALIHIKSVAGKLLTDKATGKSFALIKLKNFQEDTYDQFRKTIRSFPGGISHLSGLILDLRNNPGGLLDQAISIGDYFLSQGTIVKTVGAQGEILETEEAGPGQEGEKIPLVALVNEGSASASEIVAGALQMNDRALLIGSRTFGKGSVQTVYDLKDGAALKLTIANYLTARDYKVQSIGINPDVGLVPATVDQKMIDIFENETKREGDLKQRNDEDREIKPIDLAPPPIQMTYLSSEKIHDEESTGQIEIQDDFPVHLAQELLKLPETTRGENRQKIIPLLPPLIEGMEKAETGKVREALTKIGIDWSLREKEEKEGKPNAQVSFEILNEKEEPKSSLSAGESGFLRVTVENGGSGTYYQLIGETRSEDPIFSNLEFPIGKLGPHEKKQWKTPIKMPDFTFRRNIPVEIRFHELYDRIPKTSPYYVQIEEPPAPLFEYSYQIFDNGTAGSSGNGNRKVERGETVALHLKIKNIGKGESRSPIANLKNLDGEEIFIEKGRIEIKPLAPGATSEGDLVFRVSRMAPSKKLSLDLSILDSHLGRDIVDRLEIFLEGPESMSPPQNSGQVPPLLQTTPDSPPLIAKGNSYRLSGEASDDQMLKHLFILVGDEKVFYKSANNQKSVSFDVPIPLKKGINLITLAAQDNRELTTRMQWIVWRDK